MPTSKKSSKNIVSATSGRQFRVMSNGLVKETRRGGYITTAHIINHIFNHIYRYGNLSLDVILGYGDIRYEVFACCKREDTGFNVGCQTFDAKNAAKLFLLSGISRTLVRMYVTIPAAKAKAAVAGR